MAQEFWRWKESAWHDELMDPAKAQIITAGCDVGSVSSQAVIMLDGELYAFANMRTGSDSPNSANNVMNWALKDLTLKLEDIHYVIGTGYGRVNVPFAHRAITEISCHARGANFMYGPTVRPILDVEEEPPPVSSTCVIFAKSEATGLLRKGWPKKKVLAAYCAAMAHRVVTLLERMGVEKDFAITGGIGKHVGVVRRIENELGITGLTPKFDTQIAGGGGAAPFAKAGGEEEGKAGGV